MRKNSLIENLGIMMKLNKILIGFGLLFVCAGTTVDGAVVRRCSLPAQLEDAIKSGRADEVERLLQDPSAPEGFVDCHLPNRQKPLGYACEVGHESIVRSLLSHGADLARADSDRISPLCIAISRGYQNIVALLLNHPDAPSNFVNQELPDGGTPLMAAEESLNMSMVKLLRDHGAKKVPVGMKFFEKAIVCCDLKAINEWFDDQPSVEAAIAFVNTPIRVRECETTWLAVACSSWERISDRVVSLLLERGIAIPTTGYLARDLLQGAIWANNITIIRQQLDKNPALIDERLPNGKMPIEFAKANQSLRRISSDIISLLKR